MTTPTFTLPFAKIKRIDPRVTITRASTGTCFDYTGKVRTAAVNEPRFDHKPDTLASLGLLIEGSSTNLVLYSEELDNAAWTKTRLSITANATTAPDGAATADKLVEDATASNTHLISVAPTVSVSTVHTISVFAKAGTRTAFDLVVGQGATYTARNFNLTTGLTEVNKSGMNDAGTTDSSMVALPNGWYRCTVTMNLTQASAVGVAQIVLTNGANASYSGDGVSYLYIWGAQVEAGEFATSYIKTTSAQATRAQDLPSMSGTNFSSWFNPTEGTFLAEFDYLGFTATSFGAVFQVNDGTSDNRIGITSVDAGSSNKVYAYSYSGGASQVDFSGAGYASGSANTRAKIALAYAANDIAQANSGAAATIDTLNTLPSGLNAINIGTSLAGGGPMNGHISHLSYFPVRLTDTAIAILST